MNDRFVRRFVFLPQSSCKEEFRYAVCQIRALCLCGSPNSSICTWSDITAAYSADCQTVTVKEAKSQWLTSTPTREVVHEQYIQRRGRSRNTLIVYSRLQNNCRAWLPLYCASNASTSVHLPVKTRVPTANRFLLGKFLNFTSVYWEPYNSWFKREAHLKRCRLELKTVVAARFTSQTIPGKSDEEVILLIGHCKSQMQETADRWQNCILRRSKDWK